MELTQRDLLAKTLQAEAGNQGYNGMVAVGSVIMNRLAGGSDLGKVILQPGHFSAWNSTTGYAGGEQGQDMDFTPSARAYEVADALLSGNYEDPTGGATHYYNPQISDPTWGQSGGGDWQTIGQHVFGKANKAGPKPIPKNGTMTESLEAKIFGGASAMDGQPTGRNMQQPSAIQMQKMQQQQGSGGLLGFLRDPRTRETFASLDRSGLLGGVQQRAAADVKLMQEQELLNQENQKKTQIKNRTIEVLSQKANSGDQIAAKVLSAIQAGALDAPTGMKLYFQETMKVPKDSRTSQIKNYEYWISKGKTPSEAEALAKTGQNINIGGAASAEDKFYEARYKALGEEFVEIRKKSGQAAANNLTIKALKQLYQVSPNGPITGRLFELFPEATDVSAAIQSLRTQLAPQLRVEGSGSTSDIEYAGMLNSLGSLKNSPQANAALLDLMLVKGDILQRKAAITARVGMPEDQGGLTINQADMALLEIDREMWSDNSMISSIKDLIQNAGGFVAESGGQTVTTSGGLTVNFGDGTEGEP